MLEFFTVKGKLSDIIKWFKIMREIEELSEKIND